MNSKRILIIFCLIALLPGLGFAKGFKIGAAAGYFTMQDSRHNEIYSSGSLMYGAYFSYQVFKWMEVRGAFNFFQQRGNLTLTQEEAKLTLTPVVVGLRGLLMKGKICPYVGMGAHIISYKEALPARMGDVSGSAVGLHVEGGAYYNISKGFHVDVSIRYLLGASVEITDVGDTVVYGGSMEKAKLDGLRAGIGFGLNF